MDGRLFRPSLLKRLVYATTSRSCLNAAAANETEAPALPRGRAAGHMGTERGCAGGEGPVGSRARSGGHTSFESRDGEAHETEATLA